MVKIRILDIVGSPNLVDTEDGQRVYSAIAKHVEHDEAVEISFLGVEQIITAFANAAIGQLYNEFSEQKVSKLVTLTDMDEIARDTLVRTISRAKTFFRDRQRIRRLNAEMLGDDDDDTHNP